MCKGSTTMFKASVQACREKWAFSISHCYGQKSQRWSEAKSSALECQQPQPVAQQQQLTHSSTFLVSSFPASNTTAACSDICASLQLKRLELSGTVFYFPSRFIPRPRTISSHFNKEAIREHDVHKNDLLCY